MLNTKGMKKGVFKLFFSEIILPSFCFGKNSSARQRKANYDKYTNIIKEQLDIGNLFTKVMLIDKINYVLTGEENMHLLNNCINPIYLKNKSFKNSEISIARQHIINSFKSNNE